MKNLVIEKVRKDQLEILKDIADSILEDRLIGLWDDDPVKRDIAIDFLSNALSNAQAAHHLIIAADEWLNSKKETEE